MTSYMCVNTCRWKVYRKLCAACTKTFVNESRSQELPLLLNIFAEQMYRGSILHPAILFSFDLEARESTSFLSVGSARDV